MRISFLNTISGFIPKRTILAIFVILIFQVFANYNFSVFAFDTGAILIEREARQLVKQKFFSKKNPCMDWRMASSVSSGPGAPGQDFDISSVRAVIHFYKKPSQQEIATLTALGAVIESVRSNRVQVMCPIDVLERITSLPQVSFIAQPITASPLEIVSEAVDASGANLFHDQGITGKGVKIGIIDLGFFGYSLLLGSELPEQITKQNFRHDLCGFSFCPSQAHGTAVTEIIHDMAPDAQLYLAAVSTVDEFLDAVEWMEEKGVDIVNCSLGYQLCGPINGQGWCSKRAGEMRYKGILPVFAIGNSGMSHWMGENIDSNGDGLVEIEGDSQSIHFESYSYEEVTLSANWDDWGDIPQEARSNQDIDLMVLSPIPDSSEVERVAWAINPQEGRPGQMPVESVTFYTEPGRDYYIFLVNSHTTRVVDIHIYLQSHDLIVLEPHVPAQSLLQPSDSPLSVAVGAANLSGDLFEYSSRGPSWDGRTKPDVTGFAGLDTAMKPQFSGTSAATPTVTGAAALIKQAYPSFGPDQLQATLELLAKDIYLPGQDNGSGMGLIDISLAAKPETNPATGFWWNPARDGSGLSIGRSHRSDFLAIYSYRNVKGGSVPTWYTASGPIFQSITGPLKLLKWRGWPLGSPVTGFSSESVGELSIFYTGSNKGIMQIREPDTNTIHRQNIEKFLFSENSVTDSRESGWWWDSSQPGNGIFLEIQGDTLFAAWYHYGSSGLPRWWTFSGTLSSLEHGSISTDILEWQNGPCLFCPQTYPTSKVVGHAELRFDGNDSAILSWQTFDGLSGAYYLTRFPF